MDRPAWNGPRFGNSIKGENKLVKLDIRPLHPLFAAEITGLDLRTPPALALVNAIDSAMDQYAVCVLRDQHLDDDQQMAFAKALGKLEPSVAIVNQHQQT